MFKKSGFVVFLFALLHFSNSYADKERNIAVTNETKFEVGVRFNIYKNFTEQKNGIVYSTTNFRSPALTTVRTFVTLYISELESDANIVVAYLNGKESCSTINNHNELVIKGPQECYFAFS